MADREPAEHVGNVAALDLIRDRLRDDLADALVADGAMLTGYALVGHAIMPDGAARALLMFPTGQADRDTIACLYAGCEIAQTVTGGGHRG